MKFSFEHVNGGAGFAVLHDFPEHPDYCRVVNAVKLPSGQVSVAQQAFVACRSRLIPTAPLDADVEKHVIAIREQIASGELKIVNTRFVAAYKERQGMRKPRSDRGKKHKAATAPEPESPGVKVEGSGKYRDQ